MTEVYWSRLNRLQVGRYAEYLVKMELTLAGFQVYSPEIDDRGIDFVARRGDGPYYEVQVKSLRESGYIFLSKDKTPLSPHRLIAVVILRDCQPPNLYLISTLAWERPNSLFVSHDYKGKKSDPEWGLNVSKKNQGLLDSYAFEKVIVEL